MLTHHHHGSRHLAHTTFHLLLDLIANLFEKVWVLLHDSHEALALVWWDVLEFMFESLLEEKIFDSHLFIYSEFSRTNEF